VSYKIIASPSTNNLVQNQCGSNKNRKNGKKVRCNFKNLCLTDSKNSGTIKINTESKKDSSGRGNQVKKMVFIEHLFLAKHFKYTILIFITTL